jgi:(R,R)-butanediol dehydrogenase/meso-butanediol dehydrogenase/diacetyl reductase
MRTDMTMGAVRWHARDDLRLDRVPLPRLIEPDQVIIEVLACGICGSDIEEWTAGPLAIPSRTVEGTVVADLITLGHEFCGRVVSAGPRSVVDVGSLVAVEVNMTCGECRACREGRSTQCASTVALGLQADGGLAEYVVVPSRLCVVAPSSTDPARLALAEPLAVAVHAIRRASLGRDERIVVLGAGSLGLLTALLLQREGHQVLVVDTIEARLRIGERLGIRSMGAWDFDEESMSGRFSVCFEATGAGAAFSAGQRSLCIGGRLILLGVGTEVLGVTAWQLVERELTVIASKSHTLDDFIEAVRVISQGLEGADAIITHRFELAEALNEFEQLRRRPQDSIKRTMVRNQGS